MRRLRDDEVVALIRQAQRVARIVEDNTNALIGERIVRAKLAELAACVDDLGLELDDVYRLD